MDNLLPVIDIVPGWQQDISHCRSYDELPDNAKRYIETIEKLLDHEIQFISVGAERNQYLTKGNGCKATPLCYVYIFTLL